MDINEKIKVLINSKDKFISFESCKIIYGKPGIGKSYTIKKICEDLNLNMILINDTNVNNSNEFEDLINKTVNTKNFINLFKNTDEKNKIIIIDDYDVLLSIDRTINNTLYNILLNKKLKNIGIICICNNELIKKIGNIKKKCELIEYKIENKKDILKILSLNNKIDKKELEIIIDKTSGNIEQALKMIKYKDLNLMDNFDNIEYLYSEKCKLYNIINIISKELWLVPLRYHENLISELKNRKIKIKEKTEIYKKFLLNLCYYDLQINYGLIDNGINVISNNIYEITNIELKKKKTEKNKDNFTKLLSYLSLQKKLIKKGYIYNENFHQIGNYHINSININLYV